MAKVVILYESKQRDRGLKMNNGRKKKLAALEQALDDLQTEGRLTTGTDKLIECIKDVDSLPYSELAVIAGVSVPGIARWRSTKKAKSSRLAPLIEYAHSLIGRETATDNTSNTNRTTICDAVKAVNLSDLEGKITSALENLLGDAFDDCNIIQVTMTDHSVKLELSLE